MPDDLIDVPSADEAAQSQPIEVPSSQTTGGRVIDQPLTSSFGREAVQQSLREDDRPGSASIEPYKPDIQDYTWMDRVLAEAKRAYSDPKDQEYFIQYTSRKIKNNIAMQTAAVKQQQQSNRTQLDQILIPPIKDTGTGPRDLTEARTVNPNIDQMIELARRYDPKVDQYVQQIFKKNIANDNMETPERTRNYESLKGMSIASPDEFINKSIPSYNLAQKRSTELTILQEKIRARQQDDTQINAAMHMLQPLLNSIDVYQSRSDKSAQTRYNLFTGQVAELFAELKLQNKPIPRDRVGLEKLVAPLIQTIPGSWWPGPGEQFSDRKAYEPLDEDRKFITESFKAKRGREPTDAELGYYFRKYQNSKGLTGAAQ